MFVGEKIQNRCAKYTSAKWQVGYYYQLIFYLKVYYQQSLKFKEHLDDKI